MTYTHELDFTKKVLRNMRIDSYLISNNHIPDNIDLGMRKYLGIEQKKEQVLSYLQMITEKNTINIITDEFMCNYIIFPLPESEIFICGPYITEEMTKQSLLENAEKHNISPQLFTQFSRYYGNITRITDTSTLLALITALGETIWGNENNFTVNKHTKQKKNMEYDINIGNSLDIQDDPMMTVSLIEARYESERLLMDAVSKGQANRLTHLFGHASEFVFENRTDDETRNTKNYMIVMNTLLRKAVQEGGVPPYFIDKLSSEFAKKIEACSDIKNFSLLASEMVEKYNRLVNEHAHGKYPPSVRKAMEIIDCDLTADLSLKTVSDMLGINESYFSSLFRKETGKTFTNFVNEKRVEHAKKLLSSTSLQIQTVAQHCGILDVNYFTKLFKKHTGTTPGKFRTKS